MYKRDADTLRMQRALALFQEALEVQESARPRWLEDSCDGDPLLADLVNELLRADANSGLAHSLDRLVDDVRGLGTIRTDDFTLPDPVDNERRYGLPEEIASGGMGIVFRVFDKSLRRHVAMKVVRGHAQGEDAGLEPATVARFLDEAQITGQLTHPGIVPVHELGLDAAGRPYFTMQLVKGRDLKELIDEVHAGGREWTRTRVLGVLLKVCETMAFAHDRGVVHRDLKSSNVRVGNYGEVYVMDWGLARTDDGREARDLRVDADQLESVSSIRTRRKDKVDSDLGSPLITMDGTVLGTPFFMPPEQAAGQLEDVGPASDVYAVGAMLYQLLSGRMPYHSPGTRPSPHTVLARVLSGPPAPLATLDCDVPLELEAICEKAMAREIDERYASMSALADDLRAFLDGRVVLAHRTGLVAELKKWVSRNRGLAGSLAATFLALVGGLLTSLWLRDEALDNEALANELADDVLRVAAQQDLEDLLSEADGLWPAHPRLERELVDWVRRAGALVDELPTYRARQAELRALAQPRTEEQRQEDRRRHPDAPRLASARGRLAYMRRAYARRTGGSALPPVEVDRSHYTQEVAYLNSEARRLVDPARETFGGEELGLALALRALELANEESEERAAIHDTVAWAWFAVGADDAAIESSADALAAAPAASKEEFEGYLLRIEESVAAARSPEALREAETELASLETEIARLERRVEEPLDRDFPIEHKQAQRWNQQLTNLIDGLEALSDERTGLLADAALSPTHGWSVPRRIAVASELRATFAPGGAAAARWDKALPAIRAAYPGLDLPVQMGLVPIGADRESGLWEFWHVSSGEEPRRGDDGRLVVSEATGVVLVLIPAGKFWMGSQKSDPDGRNFDPDALDSFGPVREVPLSSFFLSKYELTQSQWRRLTAANPSRYGPDGEWSEQWLEGGQGPSEVHPVERISWDDCQTWLPRAGLMLPSEAQWEYAVRAGTEWIWFSGPRPESLVGYANLVDRYALEHGASNWVGHHTWLNDGATIHAPVGSYDPNPFGLHDVAGNVWEWCLDGDVDGFFSRTPVLDPVAPFDQVTDRVIRGGCFFDHAIQARSANRSVSASSSAGRSVGVRPARKIEPALH